VNEEVLAEACEKLSLTILVVGLKLVGKSLGAECGNPSDFH
jgi:hypothetical protein